MPRLLCQRVAFPIPLSYYHSTSPKPSLHFPPNLPKTQDLFWEWQLPLRPKHRSPMSFSIWTASYSGGPIDPSKCLVFEDAPSGVLAAKNAGMSAVMVPDPRLDSSFHDAADQVLWSLLDLNPSDWGLPPFDNPVS